MKMSHKGFAAKVRKALLLYGTTLLVVGTTGIAIAVERIPGLSLRAIDGSTGLNQAVLLVASSGLALLGSGMLLLALRGIDSMAFTDNGIVLPIRSLNGMFRGTPKVISLERIVEATAIPTLTGKTVIEFRFLDARGRERSLTYAMDWAENPSQFERSLSEGVRFRRARSHLERLTRNVRNHSTK
jgi:hypothetical protein